MNSYDTSRVSLTVIQLVELFNKLRKCSLYNYNDFKQHLRAHGLSEEALMKQHVYEDRVKRYKDRAKKLNETSAPAHAISPWLKQHLDPDLDAACNRAENQIGRRKALESTEIIENYKKYLNTSGYKDYTWDGFLHLMIEQGLTELDALNIHVYEDRVKRYKDRAIPIDQISAPPHMFSAWLNQHRDPYLDAACNRAEKIALQMTHLVPITPAHIVPLKNGVYDLDAKIFRDERNEDHIVDEYARMNVTYDNRAKCPRWTQFMNEITPSDKMRETLRTSLYEAMYNRPSKHITVLLGPHGSNGKSVFMDVINELFGGLAGKASTRVITKSINSSDKQAQQDNYFLKNKRFVEVPELRESATWETENLKEITSKKSIIIREMYKKPYMIRPTHSLFLHTNHMPALSKDDNPIRRRLKITNWDQRFEGKNEDHDLYDKLVNELSGIFNWIVKSNN